VSGKLPEIRHLSQGSHENTKTRKHEISLGFRARRNGVFSAGRD